MKTWQAVFLIPFLIFSGCRAPIQNRTGTQAPDFTLPAVGNADPVALSAVNRDTPVLLIFWASWCPSCVEEIPALNDLAKKYPAGKLRLLAVNVQESRNRVADFMKQQPMNYTVLLDESGEVSSRYGLVGLPASVLLAKGGEILYYGFSLPSNLDELLKTGRN